MKQKVWIFAVCGVLVLALVPVIMLIMGIIELPNSNNDTGVTVSKVKEPTGIFIDGFSEVKGTYFTSVEPGAETYDFSSKVFVANGATWCISTDIMGSNIILTKAVSLVCGDNRFYIGVFNNGKSQVYEVTVRLKPLFNITFNSRGGSDISAQTVAEDGFIIKPESPLLTGYEFVGWMFKNELYNFAKPVVENISLIAKWKAKTYTVTYVTEIGTMPISIQQVDYNSLFVPEIPLPDEYSEFFGWYADNAEITQCVWTYDKNLTLTAKWCSTLFVFENGIVKGLTQKGENLTNLSIPSENGITPTIAIMDNAFCYNSSLESIDIPDSVISIGEKAFLGCNRLQNINFGIDSQLNRCGQSAFIKTLWYNNQLDGAIYAANTLIGFKGTTDATKFEIAQTTKGIGDYAFENTAFVEIVINDTLSHIGAHAFEDALSLTTLVLPSNLTYIGDSAFRNATSLSSLAINNVAYIGKEAFYGCNKLTVTFNMETASPNWHKLWNKSNCNFIFKGAAKV
ncbi:MAG: leucine-rich repeat protein [Clostridia bacterium]